MVQQKREQHFLVVTFAAQGHINPALQLAKRLTRGGAAAVTFATTVSGHRKMFPAAPPPSGPVSFVPYSDGYDQGFNPCTDDTATYMSQIKVSGSNSLAAIARSAAAQGRPFTCIIYTLLLPWVADLARELAIPSALFWIQPASVFAVYYHYFHGFDTLISSLKDDPFFPIQLPKIPSFRIRDLPSFISPSSAAAQYSCVLSSFQETFETLDRELSINETSENPEKKKVKVLVNSFAELEKEQMTAVETMDLIPVGPLLPSAYTDKKDSRDLAFGGDLLKADASGDYMDWLSRKEERSVIYVSFGSFSVLPVRQREEISRALKESGRPFLWVVRGELEGIAAAEDGKLVEWCSQVEVLASGAVGCFVTHCGWNSTLESLVCGVPTVGLPQWTDQPTNARLAEAAWGVGVTAEVNSEGVVEAAELRRCIDRVMTPDGDIRGNADEWSRRARETVMEGGSSDRNLRTFVESLEIDHHSPAYLQLEWRRRRTERIERERERGGRDSLTGIGG